MLSIFRKVVEAGDVSCCGIRAQSAVMVQDSERGGSSPTIVRECDVKWVYWVGVWCPEQPHWTRQVLVTSWYASRDSGNARERRCSVEYECTQARGADVNRGNANNSARWEHTGSMGREAQGRAMRARSKANEKQ